MKKEETKKEEKEEKEVVDVYLEEVGIEGIYSEKAFFNDEGKLKLRLMPAQFGNSREGKMLWAKYQIAKAKHRFDRDQKKLERKFRLRIQQLENGISILEAQDDPVQRLEMEIEKKRRQLEELRAKKTS